MKIFYFVSFILVLFGCRERDDLNSNSDKQINELLEKANNLQIIKAERLKYANLAYEKIENKRYDPIVKKQYWSLSETYFYLNENKQFLKVSNELIQKAESQNDIETISTVSYNLGTYYYSEFKIDSAYYFYTKAEKQIKKGNFNDIEYVLNAKATILWLKKDFAGAEALSFKALKEAKTKNNNELILNCYVTIGNCLLGVNDFERALKYYNKALKESEEVKDIRKSIYKSSTYNYIGVTYQKQNQHLKAISFFQKGLFDKNLKQSDIKIYCYLTNNLAYSKFKLDDKASLHQFQETLKIGDSVKNIPIQITSKTYLGEFYLAEKDFKKANFYLKDAQQQAHKNDIFDDELKILQLLAEVNPAEKSFYSDRYIILSDSLQNVERATRNKFARIEFETDEIITERDSLTIERETLLMQRWLIAGVSVFSLLSILLWFKNKSQKAKTRELLLKQEQQKANEEIYQLMLSQQQKLEEGKNAEKQRISLELHDGVMGKLSAVRLNLYASLYKADLLGDEAVSIQIDEIQSVEKEIRNIAHDLSSNLFSGNSNFIEIVRALFKKIENHSEIQFELQVSEAVNWDLINTLIKINLYRILQEALQNIEKYANAKKVTVTMNLTDLNEINVTIADDGNGFDTSQKKSGIGLANMKIRMEELNGKFLMVSQISKGTKINLIIPV